MAEEMTVEEIEAIVRNRKNEDDAFERMKKSIGGLGFNAEQLSDGLIQPKGLLFQKNLKELAANE
ncbi:MAG: hypothetical protein KME37_07725 [Candidatus Thiodiazotropha sp. (ex Codakia orbicularis)]|nr:hypothetical protein [Candidatus Thiodiazotropha sp. (ex Codakia orbicularis)]